VSAGRGRWRVLIAGAGYIADYHLAILREIAGVEVAGACDPHPERLAALAQRWNIPHTAASVDALIAGVPAEVIHVLTPPATHAAVIRQALEAGLNVLAEKPLVLSVAECEALLALANERRVRLEVNHNATCHPMFERLKVDIAARRLGAIQHVLAVQNVPLGQLVAGQHGHWMFREPRNVLFEQGPHPLSQICELVGGVEQAETLVTNPRTLRTGATFFDNWQISLQCQRGTAQMYLAFAGSFPHWQLHVVGQDGAARLDLLGNSYVLDRVTASVPPVDLLRRGVGQGWDQIRDAAAQMARYVGATIKLTGRRDHYYLGMKGGISRFYTRLQGHDPLTAGAGREVIAGLELAAATVPGGARTAQAPAIRRPAPDERPDVLILGATGFIGPHLALAAAAQGLSVRVMARTPDSLLPAVREAAVSVAEGDVRDATAVAAAVRGCRTVIHLVASAPEGWAEYERLYIDGTRNVAEACLQAGVEQLQFASSIAALYLGDPNAVVTNATPPEPRPDERVDYAKAKVLCERLLLDLHRTQNLPVVIFRPGIVVGAGGPPEHLGVGYWPAPTRCISWGRRQHALPFVLVDDVASAMVAAIGRRELAGRAFNLVGDVTPTAAEYVAAVREATGRDVQLVRRSVAEWWALEHFAWTVKMIGRRQNNVAMSWRELTYRTGATRIDCADTKATLQWTPEADRATFFRRGVRDAVTARR
jgi:predicted dehydrogenase/nucleoside-diphosphate-sugar epimerase